jgi:hypothetical protein
MDLAVWLRSLGLAQYEATFRDNAITEKLLPSLTAEDLKDLGVSVVGHRRALLNAIADRRSLKSFSVAQKKLSDLIGPMRRESGRGRRSADVRTR